MEPGRTLLAQATRSSQNPAIAILCSKTKPPSVKRKAQACLSLSFALVLVMGCTTTPRHAGKLPTSSPAPLEVLSDPPGARVEINNQYVGETPYKGLYLRTPNQSVTIRAFPSHLDEQLQVKKIAADEPLPARVHFDMHCPCGF